MNIVTWAKYATHPLIRRIGWAVMLVGHASPWLGALGADAAASGQPHALRALLLTLTQLFFALKVLDVRWLRLPADRRGCLAFAVGVALLHAGVVIRDGHAGVSLAAAQQATLFAGVLAGGALLGRHLRRAVGVMRLRAERRYLRCMIARLLRTFADAWLPPRFLLLARACSVNRAPPH